MAIVQQVWEPDENGKSSCTLKLVEYVWNRVREGSLKIGDRLPPERTMAERLRVSRASIRTGIAYLAAVGVVDVRSGEGVFISGSRAAFPLPGVEVLRGAMIKDLTEARLIVESAILKLAADRTSDSDSPALAEEVVEMYALVEDPAGFHVRDVRFHCAMARACGNPILGTMAETLLARSNREARIAGLGCRELTRVAALHRAIYRAIRIHRPDYAAGPLESCIRLVNSE